MLDTDTSDVKPRAGAIPSPRFGGARTCRWQRLARAPDERSHAHFLTGNPAVFRLRIPLGTLGQPEDVAAAIAFLASDEANHITGAILNVDGMAQLS